MDVGKLAISMGMDMTMGNFLFFKKYFAVGHAAYLVGCSVDEIHIVRNKDIRDINLLNDFNYLFSGF